MVKHYITTAVTKVKWFALAIILIIILPGQMLAQSPSISYGSGVKSFSAGKSTSLTPTSSNVSPQGYSTHIDTINTGSYNNYSFAVDKNGYIYHASPGGVYRIAPSGGAPVLITSGTFSTDARGVAVDYAGNIFVNYDGSIKKLPPGGGSTSTTIFTKTTTYGVIGMIADANGTLYIVNKIEERNANPAVWDQQPYCTIYKIPADGSAKTTVNVQLASQTGLARDVDSKYYTINTTSNKIDKFAPLSGFSSLAATLTNPTSLVTDAGNNIYVLEKTAVKQIASNRTTVTTMLSGLSTGTSLVKSLAIDPKGVLYIATAQNPGVNSTVYLQKIKPSGGYHLDRPLPDGLHFNNATGVISGTPSVGAPLQDYKVYAYNAAGTMDSTTISLRVKYTNADLADLETYEHSPGLQPLFNKDTLNYKQVTKGQDSYGNNMYYIKPTVSDPSSTIKINGVSVTSGQRYGTAPLTLGDKVFNIVVTTADGLTSKTYKLTVTYPPSSQVYMSNPNITTSIPNGSVGLNPHFYQEVYNYTASLASDITFVKLTPTFAALATGTVNGIAITPSSPSVTVPTPYGTTTVTVVATAQDGVTKRTYTMALTRPVSGEYRLSGLTPSEGVLNPGFRTNVFSYRDTVANNITSIKIRLKTQDNDASATLNGMAVTNSVFSSPIPLTVGNNTITIVATAPNGTQKTTTIIVTRLPPASNVNLFTQRLDTKSLITKVSSSDTLDTFSASVSAGTTTVKLMAIAEDTASVIKINGTIVPSGDESASIALNTSGTTTINTIITAPSGLSKTYRLVISKTGSSNANLDKQKLNTGSALTKDVTSSTFNSYTMVVNTSILNIKYTAFLSDPAATMTVNGTPALSGVQSDPIPVSHSGTTTITTIVTAPDGVTTKTYQINITRSSSFIATTNHTYKTVGIVNEEGTTNTHPDVIVRQAVSPNGDGINDALTIDGLAAYPDNKVSIIDRTGNVVYELKGYDGSRSFDGHTDSGKKMQQGTYFYSVEYKDDKKLKRKTGYLVLKY